MRANCTDATAFIEEVCENYQKFTGKELEFETFCNNRDIQRGVPKGTAFSKFMALYNGYRDKLDTEKAIYRLSTLGIIDDYTVNFSTSTFNLIGTKKSEKEYKEILRKYLCKYYSEKTSDIRLKALSKIDEPTPIRKYLNFLVNFVYNEIQKKRKLAMHDMKSACRLGLEKGSVELKDFIDLYFNSKYARAGYSFENDKGKEVLASLPDLTDQGKNDDLKWVWKFIDYVDEDPKAGQIDNIKHLYMLEFKNPRYLQEAEGLLLHAFSQIEEKESNLTDKKLEEIYNQFTELMLEKNPDLPTQMNKHGFEFDFDSIMIKRYLQPLKNAKNTLVKLNEILN
jgi:ATP-dependent DNA helicase RecQ